MTAATDTPILPPGYEWARLYRGRVLHIRRAGYDPPDEAECGARSQAAAGWSPWLTGADAYHANARRCGACMERFPDVFSVPGMGGGTA